MSHTPGPWKVATTIGGDMAVCADTRRPEFPVAKMPLINKAEVNEANARLIAAAPELLEALSDLLVNPAYQVAVGGNPAAVDAMLAKAHAAIAKASPPASPTTLPVGGLTVTDVEAVRDEKATSL